MMISGYEINENGKLLSYNGTEKNLVIPGEVKVIGSDAFYGKEFIESVLISDGVTTIEESAFEECSNLKSVSLPATLEIIEKSAFAYCNISKIDLPKNLKKIGCQAFCNCDIKNVLIPASVTEIGLGIFNYNPIENIGIEESHKSFKSVNGVLYNKDLTRLVMFPCKYPKEEFIVPEHVKVIGEQAFASVGLKAGERIVIKIGESVKEIEDLAFGGTINIGDVYLPSSLEKIGKDAFIGFGALSNSHIYAPKNSYAYNYLKESAVKNQLIALE